MKTRDLISEFLSQRRWTMVGVSRDPRDFSRRLYQDLRKLGYDVIPVNPSAHEIDGKQCYARVQDIHPPVRCVLLMTSRHATEDVLCDCVDTGINIVWIYGINGDKDADSTALQYCNEHGLGVIAGYCPYMFLSRTRFYHRWHGYFAKIIGNYPT